jgi:hypothetical protein
MKVNFCSENQIASGPYYYRHKLAQATAKHMSEHLKQPTGRITLLARLATRCVVSVRYGERISSSLRHNVTHSANGRHHLTSEVDIMSLQARKSMFK